MAVSVTYRVTASIKNSGFFSFLNYFHSMSTKSHARSPEKRGFSIALPIKLIDQIQTIADKETRSRNGQIQHLLERAIMEYEESRDEKTHDELHSLPPPGLVRTAKKA